ncbi:MAG TPA: sigma-70 family RNA polymerase sigma factor, partial [Gemmatimonadaceae bacterium]
MPLQRQHPAAGRTRVAHSQRTADRQALLVSHVGLVHHVARQLARRLSTEAQLDELVSAGSLGLIQAVDSFDVKRGLAFSTYAVPRIRGAILDELRKLDHVSRGVRRRARDVGQARAALSTALGREPSEAELSRRMRVPASQLRQWELELQSASLASLDQPVRSDHPGATLGDAITDDRSPSIDDVLSQEQELSLVREAIGGLKEQERTVLALSFFEELKLQEI